MIGGGAVKAAPLFLRVFCRFFAGKRDKRNEMGKSPEMGKIPIGFFVE